MTVGRNLECFCKNAKKSKMAAKPIKNPLRSHYGHIFQNIHFILMDSSQFEGADSKPTGTEPKSFSVSVKSQ